MSESLSFEETRSIPTQHGTGAGFPRRLPSLNWPADLYVDVTDPAEEDETLPLGIAVMAEFGPTRTTH